MGESAEPAVPHPIVSLVRANAGAMVAFTVFLFVVSKVLVVAHMDLVTAFGLVQYGGTASVLSGAAMGAAPAMGAALAMSALVLADDDRLRPRFHLRVGVFVFCPTVLVMAPLPLYLLVVVTAYLILGLPGAGAIVGGASRRSQRRIERALRNRSAERTRAVQRLKAETDLLGSLIAQLKDARNRSTGQPGDAAVRLRWRQKPFFVRPVWRSSAIGCWSPSPRTLRCPRHGMTRSKNGWRRSELRGDAHRRS